MMRLPPIAPSRPANGRGQFKLVLVDIQKESDLLFIVRSGLDPSLGRTFRIERNQTLLVE